MYLLSHRKELINLSKLIHTTKDNLRLLSGLNLWNEELSHDIKHSIENHWKSKLIQQPFTYNDKLKDKFYVLSMFPYPSGYLHLGHVRVYAISDTIARYQRMNGKNVIHPIGWDAFGLPAENAAIDRQIPPNQWTEINITHMRNQLKQLACSFDWEREVATCTPEYYRWTQELFLKLYDAGLVYQKQALVNWDPIDETVLADEQVDENGRSWRSGAKVEKKSLKQWFIRTTTFAKDLYDGLNDSLLENWRDIIKMQKHWIGECNGVNFDFEVIYNIENNSKKKDFMTIWTNSPGYIEHTKFVAIKNTNIIAINEGLTGTVDTQKLTTTLRNPFNSETIPIFVTNEIEYELGSDCYLGIPMVSEQAAEFARTYNINFNTSLSQGIVNENRTEDILRKAKELKIGGYYSSAKLRDWLISRQRYWGTPIPIIHCSKCGSVPVPRKDLPVVLPHLTKLAKKGGSILNDVLDWVNVSCPKCGETAKRETDTMDTFVDSSWYFLRFLDPKNTKEMFDRKKAFEMTPVDLYIGGKEHGVLHLYYARFISYFLHSIGLLPEKEPFKRLLVNGMVNGRTYRIKDTGEYLSEKEVEKIDFKKGQAMTKNTGQPVIITWEKMSKSKYNGVDPDDMFKEYSVDTTRLLLLADVAPTSPRNWNSNTFPGILNWQKRLWLTIRTLLLHRNNPPTIINQDKFNEHEKYLWDSRNFYLKGTTFNYLISQQISVGISKQQGLTNSIRKSAAVHYAHGAQFERALATQIIMLAPMAPHFASELWSGLISAPNRLNTDGEICWDKSVLEQNWPEIDQNYELDIECQVNSYENCVVKIPRYQLDKLTKEEAMDIAACQLKVQKCLENRNVLKSDFKLYRGCKAIINILTDRPSQNVALENCQ